MVEVEHIQHKQGGLLTKESFCEALEKQLNSKSEFFTGEGTERTLNKHLVSQLAREYNFDLLTLLRSSDVVRKWLFVPVQGAEIFKLETFLAFVNNHGFLPDNFSAYENKIGLAVGNKYFDDSQDVVLNWKYKDCILEGGQTKEDQKRQEIYFNEVLAPDQINRLLDDKVFVNWQRFDKNGVTEAKNLLPNDNFIIKGNNLVVLHSLKERFAGRVKLIYIDPPYNTGNDGFKYNDNFNHSTWLTFMKNRLEAARELLSDDGVIFVQCDDKEQAYLKVLMDKIFEKHFVTNITCKVKSPSGVASNAEPFFDCSEYILCYSKGSKGNLDFNPYKFDSYKIDKNADKITNGYHFILDSINLNDLEYIDNVEDIELFKVKQFNIETISSTDRKSDKCKDIYYDNFDKIFQLVALSGGKDKKVLQKIMKLKNSDDFYLYRYKPIKGKNAGQIIDCLVYKKRGILFLKDYSYKNEEDKIVVKQDIITNIISTDLWNGIANEGNVILKEGKKPEKLIEMLLFIMSNKGDIVLDYHLGSGTTCAVAHKMGRQYIGVEQLDYGENDSVIRLKKVIGGEQGGISKSANWKGGGSFVYCELANDSEKFRKKVEKAKSNGELLELFEKAKNSSFLSWRVETDKLNGFENLTIEQKKKILEKLVDDNTLYINYTDIDSEDYNISEQDKKLNREFYGID
jgi:adenine-specific DNA-methyltransferase